MDELAFILSMPANGNNVSLADAKKEAEAVVAKYDTNGDGELDIEEVNVALLLPLLLLRASTFADCCGCARTVYRLVNASGTRQENECC